MWIMEACLLAAPSCCWILAWDRGGGACSVTAQHRSRPALTLRMTERVERVERVVKLTNAGLAPPVPVS